MVISSDGLDTNYYSHCNIKVEVKEAVNFVENKLQYRSYNQNEQYMDESRSSEAWKTLKSL